MKEQGIKENDEDIVGKLTDCRKWKRPSESGYKSGWKIQEIEVSCCFRKSGEKGNQISEIKKEKLKSGC